MNKPTPAQLKVLMMIRDGYDLHVLRGVKSSAWLSKKLGGYSIQTVPSPTLQILIMAGWLHDLTDENMRWHGSKYTLSESGIDIVHEVIRNDYQCKICGAMPDSEGDRLHGDGCFQICPTGAGEDYIVEADLTALREKIK